MLANVNFDNTTAELGDGMVVAKHCLSLLVHAFLSQLFDPLYRLIFVSAMLLSGGRKSGTMLLNLSFILQNDRCPDIGASGLHLRCLFEHCRPRRSGEVRRHHLRFRPRGVRVVQPTQHIPRGLRMIGYILT
jgi:hypothetical protein